MWILRRGGQFVNALSIRATVHNDGFIEPKRAHSGSLKVQEVARHLTLCNPCSSYGLRNRAMVSRWCVCGNRSSRSKDTMS